MSGQAEQGARGRFRGPFSHSRARFTSPVLIMPALSDECEREIINAPAINANLTHRLISTGKALARAHTHTHTYAERRNNVRVIARDRSSLGARRINQAGGDRMLRGQHRSIAVCRSHSSRCINLRLLFTLACKTSRGLGKRAGKLCPCNDALSLSLSRKN